MSYASLFSQGFHSLNLSDSICEHNVFFLHEFKCLLLCVCVHLHLFISLKILNMVDQSFL